MAMGVRYVNAAYLKDAVIDIGRPQHLLPHDLPVLAALDVLAVLRIDDGFVDLPDTEAIQVRQHVPVVVHRISRRLADQARDAHRLVQFGRGQQQIVDARLGNHRRRGWCWRARLTAAGSQGQAQHGNAQGVSLHVFLIYRRALRRGYRPRRIRAGRPRRSC